MVVIDPESECPAAHRPHEEQFRTIFEAASDGFVLRDAQLRTLEANPAFYRMYGFSPQTIEAGGGYPAHFPRQYVQEREAQFRRALEGHETHVETIALRADGEPFWVDLRVIPVRYRGEPHVLQVVRDITALREREQALQRSQARLRATVDAAFDCVIGMDGEGRIVEFNGAAERCFGHRREDVMGHRLADLILPERHREAHNRGLAHFQGSGRGPMIGRLVETTALRADGSEFPVELAISVAAVPEGSIFIGHLRDISARKAAEAERTALEAQLRQAQKMEAIGQLTGGLAHDFNNILTSVVGYLVMGRERAEHLADATLQRQLAQAHTAARRATELVAQLMAFARRQPSQRRLLALAPLVSESLQLLRATLPAQMVLDATAIDSEADAATIQVHADGVQLEQVLLNLCINARDAMGTQGRIGVHLRHVAQAEGRCASCGASLPRGAWAELRVSDTGPGISADLMQRMFEPFYTTKEVGRGTGMGLAMVHGIVHNHQGHILVESRPGEGSVFRILLPAAKAELSAAVGPSSEPAAPGAAPLQGRVMLVEDDVQVGEFMAELLSGWGLNVQWLQDPVAAGALISGAAVDLLVTDQTMPGMTGLELARVAQASRTAMPVLLYSGNAQAVPEAEWRQAGIRAVLCKPIDPGALRALVDRWLNPAIERSAQAAIGRGISG